MYCHWFRQSDTITLFIKHRFGRSALPSSAPLLNWLADRIPSAAQSVPRDLFPRLWCGVSLSSRTQGSGGISLWSVCFSLLTSLPSLLSIRAFVFELLYIGFFLFSRYRSGLSLGRWVCIASCDVWGVSGGVQIRAKIFLRFAVQTPSSYVL